MLLNNIRLILKVINKYLLLLVYGCDRNLLSDFDEKEESHLCHLLCQLRVKKIVSPRCLVRRLLLQTVISRQLGAVRRSHVRWCCGGCSIKEEGEEG